MAVSKAIQSGETESIGNPKDMWSGAVASRCPSSPVSSFSRRSQKVSEKLETFVRLFPDLQTFIQTRHTGGYAAVDCVKL